MSRIPFLPEPALRLIPHPALLGLTLCVVVGAGLLTPHPTRADVSEFRVVANTDARGEAISKKVLVAAYRGETVRWASGMAMQPLDQSARSSLRKAFSRDVLGQSIQEQQVYWIKQISMGRRNAPPVKVTDEEVLAFLVANPGSIGYVSVAASIPAGLKVLSLVN